MDIDEYYSDHDDNCRKCCNVGERDKCQKPCDEDCTNQDQNITQCQGGQSQETGDLEQIQGSQSQEQGDQIETQGDQAQTQGDQVETQGDQAQTQGDQTETQGDQAQTQGDQTETQGDQAQIQGDQAETQGDQIEFQGDQAQTQGDQVETQGDQSQTQGNLTETLGDMTQLQGGETQGDQIQGEQMQSMTGHGGQTQGEQTQGDQILVSNPNISTPVNVSGVNINVKCCGDHKRNKCCHDDCKKEIISLLRLIKLLALPIIDPANAEINFFFLGAATLPTPANIGDIAECTFNIIPVNGENQITILTDNLEALSIEATDETPNLFIALLDYLTALPNNFNQIHSLCNKCSDAIEQQLFSFFVLQQEISVFLESTSIVGFIFKISNGIVYLVDDLVAPTIINAIPICKILGFQPL